MENKSKRLFDRLDPCLQFPAQVDLSLCPFAGMGYGRFTDSEMVPNRFRKLVSSRRRRLGSCAFVRKARDLTIHPIRPAAPKLQRRLVDPVEFKRYNRIQFPQHEIDKIQPANQY
jgi:hypothetical protein